MTKSVISDLIEDNRIVMMSDLYFYNATVLVVVRDAVLDLLRSFIIIDAAYLIMSESFIGV